MRCTALLFVALAGSALAGPTGQRSTCALHCNDAESYAYESGKSYVYEYSVTTSTALLETFEDDAHLHITANAHIDVSAPCEYILKLTDVNLDGSSHGPEFAAAVTKSPCASPSKMAKWRVSAAKHLSRPGSLTSREVSFLPSRTPWPIRVMRTLRRQTSLVFA
nr:uncharacterized protein LOC113813402 [Penaeus vannamei]